MVRHNLKVVPGISVQEILANHVEPQFKDFLFRKSAQMGLKLLS